MLENLTMNDTIYLISIVYIGYLLGKITNFLIEKIDETLKKKEEKQLKEQES